MKTLSFLCALLILTSCGKETPQSGGPNVETGKTTSPNTQGSPPTQNSEAGDGSKVGNGGDELALRFTLTALKSFEYLKLKDLQKIAKYESCVNELIKNIAGEEIPNEKWEAIKLSQCGTFAFSKQKEFERVDDLLKTTHVFISNNFICDQENVCGNSWKIFPEDLKIYLNSTKWSGLSELEKISESMAAYTSIAKLSLGTDDPNTIEDIYQNVFKLDFSIDTFRRFSDENNLRIINDGSESYSQDKIIIQMELAMDCFQLAKKRFPGQININAVSLIDNEDISDKYYEISNFSLVKFSFVGFKIDPDTWHHITLGVKETDKVLVLGRNTNLQKCYNALVTNGRSTWITTGKKNVVTSSPKMKIPEFNASDIVLEFTNIAMKSMDYILKDQKMREKKYNECKMDFPTTGELNCSRPSLSRDLLELIESEFSEIAIEETTSNLCTFENPSCNETSSVAAINIPESNKILINSSKWKKLSDQEKIKISIHEIFGILGIEQNNYVYSAQFSPLILVEVFHTDFFIDEFTSYLESNSIYPLSIGNYSEPKFKERAMVLKDCLDLAERRFPGRLNIGLISLDPETKYTSDPGLQIKEDSLFEYLGLRELTYKPSYKQLDPSFEYLNSVGKGTLFLGSNTTLQQCYNKVVAKGLSK